METKMRKGQSSVEYLMTYGWALLVIGVVMIALWVMGAFKPPATPPGCTGFSQIEVLDQKASSADDKVWLTIQNNAGVKMIIDEVKGSVYGSACSDITEPPAGSLELRAGELKQINLTVCPFLETGLNYQADINISYINPTSGIEHNSVGECHGMVE